MAMEDCHVGAIVNYSPYLLRLNVISGYVSSGSLVNCQL